MIKNRTAQLIYQTMYCTLGLVGTIASFGIFDNVKMLRWDCYVHFTNLSNYFCIALMLAALIQTVKKKDDSPVKTAPLLTFMGMLGILLTFLVFNFMLAGAPGRDPQANWRVASLTFHVALPVLYVVHWFLFCDRKACKWYYPLASVCFPLVYVLMLLVQAVILRFDSSILIPNSTTPLIYPYFFLNVDKLGVMGVLGWIGILFVGFVLMGSIFWGLSKLGKKK